MIAIIGMEGSGKTVLTTTLAKRLSIIDARGIFLNPQGVKTLKYVESVWHTLQSGDWPPSTPPGELFELKWKFQVVGELECDVRLIDVAGQDLRLLFGDEGILSVESLPGHLQALAEYCRSADIILFLINLKDFVGQSNAEQRTANEAAIKSAMDYLGGNDRRRRVCLVLTQTDLYRNLARVRGGWLNLAAEAVPYVFSAHVRVQQVAVHPISAVADTQVAVDRDGTPRRVPTAGFRSEGLDEVITWLTTQVRDVKREQDQEAQAAALVAQQKSVKPVGQQPPLPTKDSPWGGIIGGIVAIIIAISLTWVYLSDQIGVTKPQSVPEPQIVSVPKPQIVSKNAQYVGTKLLESYGVRCWGRVVNNGVAGNVTIRAKFTQGGKSVRQYETVSMQPGQYYDFGFIDTSSFYQSDGPLEYEVWAE